MQKTLQHIMHPLRTGLFAVLCALWLAVPSAQAQTQVVTNPWPADKVANGKIDDVICGVHGEDASRKKVESILGKGTLAGRGEISESWLWTKDHLRILVNFSEDGIVSVISVTGTDPSGTCKTAHGLQLGQTLDEVKAMYGHVYEFYKHPNGNVEYTYVWQENSDYYLQLTFDKKSQRLTRINAQYSLE